MVTYPWLRDYARNWDKFLEHGHRLAGMLIGIWSIALAVAAWRMDSRRWVKFLGLAILLGVICQGLLGGFRVQLNERGLAMLHGIFAAVVFSLMGIMVAATGRRWNQPGPLPAGGSWGLLSLSILSTLALQYLLGSLIRHRGSGLHEHLGLGLLALLLIFANAIVAVRARVPWVRTSALLLLGAALGQVALGIGTWVAKYGFAHSGYVAVADSLEQVTFRTAHMVWGVITLMTAAVHACKVFRAAALAPVPSAPAIEIRRAPSGLVSGGIS
jgi:cytochrome c oxidase assembly protein subunit 15